MVMCKRADEGFTTVELTVVVLIVALLIAIAVPVYAGTREQALVAEAKSDLRNLAIATEQLVQETDEWPNHLPTYEPEDAEISLSDCAAGITCTDGDFPDWNGPYTTISITDPWGNAYWFDPDYWVDGESFPALVSFGPNGQGVNQYDGDDIVIPLPCNEAADAGCPG